MAGHFSHDSGMATYLLRNLRHPTPTIKTPHDLEKLYEARVWFPLNDLDAVIDEILHLIDLLPSQENYVDAVIAVKFYIISWCTLSDILAKLINKIFDLGIDEKDINLMMLFRNEHVKASAYSGQFRPLIPKHSFHPLRLIPSTDSNPNLPPITEYSVHC